MIGNKVQIQILDLSMKNRIYGFSNFDSDFFLEGVGGGLKSEPNWMDKHKCWDWLHEPVGYGITVLLLIFAPPVMLAILADIVVDVGWLDGDAELCVDNPITLTPFTWPPLALPKASFKTAGCVWVAGCVCWCLSAFVRRLVTGTSRFRLGCSTGNTRRRFFGNFDRA